MRSWPFPLLQRHICCLGRVVVDAVAVWRGRLSGRLSGGCRKPPIRKHVSECIIEQLWLCTQPRPSQQFTVRQRQRQQRNDSSISKRPPTRSAAAAVAHTELWHTCCKAAEARVHRGLEGSGHLAQCELRRQDVPLCALGVAAGALQDSKCVAERISSQCTHTAL